MSGMQSDYMEVDLDPELEAAISLSLQDYTTNTMQHNGKNQRSAGVSGGAASTSPPPAAPPAPPPEPSMSTPQQAIASQPTTTPHSVNQSQAPITPLAAALQQALAQAMQGINPGGAGQGTLVAPSSAFANRPTAPSPSLPPSWLQSVIEWWWEPPNDINAPSSTSHESPTVLITQSSDTWPKSGDLVECLGHLSKVFGPDPPIWPSGMPSPPPKSIYLKFSRNPSEGMSEGQLLITMKDLEALVASWVMRMQGRGGNFDTLQALGAAHDRAQSIVSQPSPPTTQTVKSFLSMVAMAAARHSFSLLANDEEDIYYSSGQVASSLLSSLKRSPPTISVSFLGSLCSPQPSGCVVDKEGCEAWGRTLRSIFKELDSIKLGMDTIQIEGCLRALDFITSAPNGHSQRSIASILAQELLMHSQLSTLGPSTAAQRLDSSCLLSNLMRLSSTVDPSLVLQRSSPSPSMVVSRGKEALLSIPGYPLGSSGSIEVALKMLQTSQAKGREAMHRIVERVIRGKDRAGAREIVLSWMAMSIQVNAERASIGDASRTLNPQDLTRGGSDAFGVGLSGLLLAFCRPFVNGYLADGGSEGGGKFKDLFEKHLNLYSSLGGGGGGGGGGAVGVGPWFRVPLLPTTPCMATGRGISSSSSQHQPDRPHPFICNKLEDAATGGGGGGLSFISECFYLCQQALWVGYLPALYRSQVVQQQLSQRMQQEQGLSDQDLEAQGVGGGGGLAAKARAAASTPLGITTHLVAHCNSAALFEPSLLDDLVSFAMLTLAWLKWLLTVDLTPAVSDSDGAGSSLNSNSDANLAARDLERRKAAFSHLPEFVLSDALAILDACIRGRQAVVVASKPVSHIMGGIVALLSHPTCVVSPILHDKAVKLMLCMLGPQLDVKRRTHGALGSTFMEAGEAALVAAVMRTAAGEQGLIPALMRSYVSADLVVGLDVDKDSFDKYSFRQCIDMILEELWRDEVCRRNLLALSSSTSSSTSSSSSSSGGDGSEALREYLVCLLSSLVHCLKDALDRLSDVLTIQEAKGQVEAWQALPQHERQKKEAFLKSQAQAAKGFLSVGVNNLRWLGVLAAHEGVRPAFLGHPDTLRRSAFASLTFLQLLSGSKCRQMEALQPSPEEYGFIRLDLIEGVANLMLTLAQPSVANPQSPGRQQQQGFDRDRPLVLALSEEQDLDLPSLGAALEILNEGGRVSTADRWEGLMKALAPFQPSAVSAQDQGAAPQDMEVDWQPSSYSLPPLSGPELSLTEIEAAYIDRLSPLVLGEFDSELPKAYNRAYKQMSMSMSMSSGTSSAAKTKRIAKELKDLRSGRTPLPCYASGSIFLRHDQERLDVMRCLISGPEGTPYEMGLFLFDLLLPEGYPSVPPLMEIETTGGGRVRFNPNAYADGKICLSLLGTWHGGNESEKWHPVNSSLYQLVLSVQSQILVTDPYFNEPAVEAMKGTKEGDQISSAYNSDLKLNTLRYAVNEMIQSPPVGFEDVVRGHFSVLKRRMVEVGKRWVGEEGKEGMPPWPTLQGKMDSEVVKMHGLLSQLE